MQSTPRSARLSETFTGFIATMILTVMPIALAPAAKATGVGSVPPSRATALTAGTADRPGMMAVPFADWVTFQTAQSTQRLLANISPAGTAPGVVVASPERYSPNYYYHWVRDAALTLNTVVDLFARARPREAARASVRSSSNTRAFRAVTR